MKWNRTGAVLNLTSITNLIEYNGLKAIQTYIYINIFFFNKR